MANRTTSSPKSIPARRSALILIDVMTDFEFVDGDELLRRALRAARNISLLAHRARKAGVPVVYVNDNFGKWQEDFKTMSGQFMRPQAKGRKVAELLKPDRDSY